MSSKKRKRSALDTIEAAAEMPTTTKMDEGVAEGAKVDRRATVRLCNETGGTLGAPMDLPLSVSVKQLQLLCDTLLKQNADASKSDEAFEPVPCLFYCGDEEIRDTLESVVDADAGRTEEQEISVVYEPQAVFRVQPVTRCTSSLPGHGEPVISVQFSPDGRYLASGSGDKTVRLWDLNTELPQFTCSGHRHWVLVISWAPDGQKLASACKNGEIRLWNPVNGELIGKPLLGHKKWITGLAWKPLHLENEGQSRQLASSSKDNDIRIWDTVTYSTLRVLSGHTASVTMVKWGGEGLLYSSSQDRTVKVWRADDGVLCRTLIGHAHWVNTLALSTDYVLRTGAFDPQSCVEEPVHRDRPWDGAEARRLAIERYRRMVTVGGDDETERLVSGSDDFTLFMWRPSADKKPLARMTGHQQLINQVLFSGDGRLVASASFDKSVKLWCGRTGKYLSSLRAHVQSVYQIAFSADSRLLVSGSADSTLKVWDVRNRKLSVDLPGHGDEVFAVDWSPDGRRVASGGKDKLLKLWRQ